MFTYQSLTLSITYEKINFEFDYTKQTHLPTDWTKIFRPNPWTQKPEIVHRGSFYHIDKEQDQNFRYYHGMTGKTN